MTKEVKKLIKEAAEKGFKIEHKENFIYITNRAGKVSTIESGS